MISQREQLESQIAQAKRMRAKLGDLGPFGDGGMSAHIAELEQHLASLQAADASVARVELKFDGEPVRGQSGIRADFGAAVLGAFQKLLKQFARIKGIDDSLLFFTAPARGSFGFVLEEMGQEQLVGKSKLAEAADGLNAVLQRMTSSEDSSIEDDEDIHPSLMRPIQDFLGLLSKNSATALVDAGSTSVRFDKREVETASARVKQIQITRSENSFAGELRGVLPADRRFEFLPDGEGAKVIKGTVDDSLDILEDIKPFDMMRCRVSIEENVAEYPSGYTRRWNVLKSISDV